MKAIAAALLLASAQPVTMDLKLRDYLGAELLESYAWAGLGLAGLAAAMPLFSSNDRAGRGFSIPVIGFSIVQLALGIGLWVRTPPQLRGLSAQLQEDPAAFASAERARMRRVNAWFPAYKLVEVAVLLSGATLAANGVVGNDQTMLGVGAGLLVEATVFLVLDYFAEHRAHGYERAVIEFGR